MTKMDNRGLPVSTDTQLPQKTLNLHDFLLHNSHEYRNAQTYMELLGYTSPIEFEVVVNKAITVCLSLGGNINRNFIKEAGMSPKNHTAYENFSLFACQLIALHADEKKQEVQQCHQLLAKLQNISPL